jgi:hypothetical protein
MDHLEATRLTAVEKYLLNELPPELRDEFEDHFFDCMECATDLRATAAFMDAAKKEFEAAPVSAASPKAKKKSPFAFLWTPAFAVPAFALLLFVIAYQYGVVYPRFAGEIAQLKTPEILPSISMAGANSRGGDLPSAALRSGHPFLLLVDIPTQDRFSSYTCSLESPSGSTAFVLQVSAQQAKDTVSIRVPAGNREPGTYTLIVRGNTNQNPGTAAVDLAHLHFVLRNQN